MLLNMCPCIKHGETAAFVSPVHDNFFFQGETVGSQLRARDAGRASSGFNEVSQCPKPEFSAHVLLRGLWRGLAHPFVLDGY